MPDTSIANVYDRSDQTQEQCENCGRSDLELHYDVEGVPICDVCWNDPSVWAEIGTPSQTGER